MSPPPQPRAGHVQGENLTIWRVGTVPTRLKQQPWTTHDASAVYLGWEAQPQARSMITWPPEELRLPRDDALVFSASAADAKRRNPIDFSIEVEDAAGAVAQVPLSRMTLLQPQIEAPVIKVPFLETTATSEIVFQSYAFLLEDFVVVNPALDPANLSKVRFVFDRTPAAVVVLEDIGFRALPGATSP